MNASHVTWLVHEIEELLTVSSVGLYEFLWSLRGRYGDLGEDELREDAHAALRILLDDRNNGLVWLVWPDVDRPVPADLDHDVVPTDWADPAQSVPYLAISRN